jgi:hypothetical protein
VIFCKVHDSVNAGYNVIVCNVFPQYKASVLRGYVYACILGLMRVYPPVHDLRVRILDMPPFMTLKFITYQNF